MVKIVFQPSLQICRNKCKLVYPYWRPFTVIKQYIELFGGRYNANNN